MAFTYGGDPTNSARDLLRLRVGDTDSADPLLTDAEVAYFLTQRTDPILAAADACDAIAGRFSRKADFSAGKTSVSASQRAGAYRTQAQQLRDQAVALSGAAPAFGGLSEADKTTLASDADAVPPLFERGQDDHPGTVPNTDPLRRTY